MPKVFAKQEIFEFGTTRPNNGGTVNYSGGFPPRIEDTCLLKTSRSKPHEMSKMDPPRESKDSAHDCRASVSRLGLDSMSGHCTAPGFSRLRRWENGVFSLRLEHLRLRLHAWTTLSHMNAARSCSTAAVTYAIRYQFRL